MSIEEWVSARRAGDDRRAVDLTLRWLVAGDCPLPLRLALPGCWRRARGPDDLDDLLDSLFTWPGTRGSDRALVAIAAGRLHPAALATTPALAPAVLLLAAGLGALATGSPGAALALLPPALPRPASLLARVAACEVALALATPDASAAPLVPWQPAPWAPPVAVAQAVAASLDRRARGLHAAGQPIEALGLAELALRTCPAGAPVALPASLLRLITLLRFDLDDLVGATGSLDALTRLLAGSAEGDPLGREAEALRVRWLLEHQQLAEAEQRVAQLVATSPPAAPDHLALRLLHAGLPLASPTPDAAAAIASLRAILADARALGDADAAATASHWLGVWLGHQPGHAAEARGHLLDALQHRSGRGPTHPLRVETLLALAVLQGHQGELDEAEQNAREALVAIEQVAGAWHPLARIAATCLGALDSARAVPGG